MKKINKVTAALIIGAVAFVGYNAVGTQTKSNCVSVHVDFGSLDSNKIVESCVSATEHTNALKILEQANLKIAGTDKYGLQIVCRVNELPGPKKEKCESMPPENAYWAVIVKNNESFNHKWGWAQTGISDVYLNPGDSLGLVFIENEEMRWPN